MSELFLLRGEKYSYDNGCFANALNIFSEEYLAQVGKSILKGEFLDSLKWSNPNINILDNLKERIEVIDNENEFYFDDSQHNKGVFNTMMAINASPIIVEEFLGSDENLDNVSVAYLVVSEKYGEVNESYDIKCYASKMNAQNALENMKNELIQELNGLNLVLDGCIITENNATSISEINAFPNDKNEGSYYRLLENNDNRFAFKDIEENAYDVDISIFEVEVIKSTSEINEKILIPKFEYC